MSFSIELLDASDKNNQGKRRNICVSKKRENPWINKEGAYVPPPKCLHLILLRSALETNSIEFSFLQVARFKVVKVLSLPQILIVRLLQWANPGRVEDRISL